MNSAHLRRPAFTLVELLVVVGIITILAGMILVAAKSARNSANRTVCASNLHQIAGAIQSYASENSGEIPAVYGLSYTHGRPMAWLNFGMHRDGIGCGGLLLLVSQPVGLATRGYLPDTSLYHCPGDYITPGHQATTYLYCYVPRGGSTYSPWYLQPAIIDPSKYSWRDGLLARFERHNINVAHSASTALMIEGTALHHTGPTGGARTTFHGPGGNILYFDGHVQNVDMDLPFFPFYQVAESVESTFSNADGAAGG